MKRRRGRDIIIELTSLLDVIMIIIFMVMKENSKMIVDKQNAVNSMAQVNSEQTEKIEELQGKADDLTAQLDDALEKLGEGNAEELLEQLHAAENKLAGYQAIDDVVIVLNIGLENNYNNTVRTLSFGRINEQTQVIENNSDEEFEVTLNKLKVFVSEYIDKITADKTNQTIVYIVFTYNAQKVYQRDYKAVGEVLEQAETKANNGNFRYRINPVT